MSTVTYAGFSRVNGVLKFRTACDAKRIKQLEKLGDTDVDLDKLPMPMDKNQAVKYVLTNLGRFQVNAKEAESVLTNLVKDENPFKAPKKPVAKKPQKTVVVKGPKLVVANVADKPSSPEQAAKIRAEFMKKLRVAYNNT
jgi:hypothetical protein